MKLSDNLSLAEAIKSNTAIKYGIDNSPTEEHLENLKAIAQDVFQRVREHFGKAIYVSSGYRSESLNKCIGGSSTSQHCKGEALDLDAQVYGGLTNAQLFSYIEEWITFDQLIWEFGSNTEPDWVHVSYKKDGNNRGQKLMAYKKGGKTLYKEI
jgi:zinc D-Ala-D-Ala carboxypeptidase